MSRLSEDDFAPTVAQAMRVALLRLTPHKPLDAVRTTVSEWHEKVKASNAAVQAAEDAVIAQTAQIVYEDKLLDRLVIDCAREKRATISGPNPDRDPSFREVFSEAASEAMRGMPDDAQNSYVAVVLTGLELPANAALKEKYGAKIKDQQAAVDAAVARRVALEGELAKRENEQTIVLTRARKAFNEAQLDAGSITKDESLVDSLFAFRAARKKKKADDDKKLG